MQQVVLFAAELLSMNNLAWNVETFKWEVGFVELLQGDIFHFYTQE